jgi:hypothetical protein
MWACADFERWQPRIASPVGASQYACEPSASTRDEDWFVLPAHRPAPRDRGVAERDDVGHAGA